MPLFPVARAREYTTTPLIGDWPRFRTKNPSDRFGTAPAPRTARSWLRLRPFGGSRTRLGAAWQTAGAPSVQFYPEPVGFVRLQQLDGTE